MTESLAASVRGLRYAAFDAHMERLPHLTIREVISLSKARKMGLTEVFDLLSDTDFLVSDWHASWKLAYDAVYSLAVDHGLDGLPVVCSAAADVAACQGLARLLGSDVSIDVHLKLSEPWRFVMERHCIVSEPLEA
ncbi:hypothetical protein [Demequina mangrovi]|uniref:Uncharacterized protein n=1 Tax=Demequina mangrovi TaxID=1043493 RepID=A0A1H6TPX0_9MICO|nr:hypothetical protein [Demequina mangrovi]SEI79267.1 hypothetical protein SAMN05421637_0022 [Demequina mangrovi]